MIYFSFIGNHDKITENEYGSFFNIYKHFSKEIKSDKATVIMFICNHCPYVIHIIDEVVRLTDDYIKKGVSFAAISSNDVANYPEDSPEKMKEIALTKNFKFPYLYDESLEYTLPELPLPIPLDEYTRMIIEKARKQASNMSEVDRLLKQKDGAERARKYRDK